MTTLDAIVTAIRATEYVQSVRVETWQAFPDRTVTVSGDPPITTVTDYPWSIVTIRYISVKGTEAKHDEDTYAVLDYGKPTEAAYKVVKKWSE